MKKIGIMGALPDEVTHLAAALENSREERYAGVSYLCARRGALEIVLCCAGMGKANAAATTQVLATRYGVEAVIFNGIAGNTGGQTDVGDMVVGKTLVYHDAEDAMLAQSAPFVAEYASDAHLVALASAACEAVGVHHVVGKIATGDQFIGDAVTKQRIVDACAPDCVEMEGAAVAQIAQRNGLPFVVLRTMSDNSDQSVAQLNDKTFEVREYIKTTSAVALHLLDALEREARA